MTAVLLALVMAACIATVAVRLATARLRVDRGCGCEGTCNGAGHTG